MQKQTVGNTLLLGINGAQGTGKSTLADFLACSLEQAEGWRVAVLSVDDFYLTRAEREHLGDRVHPLLKTRGVPGTHDLGMLTTCIDALRNLAASEKLPLPRFDKANDDRSCSEQWPVVTGPVDMIILEGWCVGSAPQTDDALVNAINLLEEQEDPSGNWRRFVNDQLAGAYADLFGQLDVLVYLRIPNFSAVHRWRLEQEQKLAAVTQHQAAGIMSEDQIARFIQHYERITKADLASLPGTADVVLELDENHDCVRCDYASAS